jgi:hypothetical protein
MIVLQFSVEELRQIVASEFAKVSPKAAAEVAVEIIDRAELCRRLSITEPTVILYEKKGKIPSLRVGSAVRYNYGAVLKAIESKKK